MGSEETLRDRETLRSLLSNQRFIQSHAIGSDWQRSSEHGRPSEYVHVLGMRAFLHDQAVTLFSAAEQAGTSFGIVATMLRRQTGRREATCTAMDILHVILGGR